MLLSDAGVLFSMPFIAALLLPLPLLLLVAAEWWMLAV